VGAAFRELAAEVSPAGFRARCGDLDLGACDAVLVRTMPPGSLEQVVFRMDVLGRLAAGGRIVINGPRAIEAAVDKYLTTVLLAEAGLRVPRTYVCQSAEDVERALELLDGRGVMKPLFGAEGRGIARIEDPAIAYRIASLLVVQGAVLYVQEFIEHEGSDLRLFVLGERVFGMRRVGHGDWRTNISRGATAEPLRVTDDLADTARRAAAAVGAEVAGVDLLPGRDGHVYTLEVNAVPGWRALSAATGEDIAERVVDHVEWRIREART
jgi:ribosomal protein S6--L-glutamate ligase